jgi:hypothetical protein
MPRRRFVIMLWVLVTAIAVGGFVAAALARWHHIPTKAIGTAQAFVDRLNAGDMRGAYQLTEPRASVGTSLEEFASKVQYQLNADAFPLRRPVKFLGVRSGVQSYGNRLRRWIARRKIDPDQITVDYFFGLPFEVRLASDGMGEWKVVFFQSHAA